MGIPSAKLGLQHGHAHYRVAAAAERWVAAVNADGQYGHWRYAIAKKPEDVKRLLGV